MLIKKSRIPVTQIVLFGFWPSFIKVFIYKLFGGVIGKNVTIGLGSVIIGKQIVIGDNVTIGLLTIIRGREIEIDAYSSIGSFTFIDVPKITIGSGSRITEQVVIGGPESPDSSFKMGKNSIIMQMSYLNPYKSITIGDDTGIGGHCLLFTHGSWLNIFDGYPLQFEPISIGNSVWLPWRVFIMPGTKIGDGSVIGANSLVRGSIPKKALAIGSPAKVIAKEPDFPKKLNDKKKEEILYHILDEMIEYLSYNEIRVDRKQEIIDIEYRYRRGTFRKNTIEKSKIQVITVKDLENIEVLSSVTIVVSLHKIPSNIREKCIDNGICWVDIDKKEMSENNDIVCNQLSDYLRHYGIRLDRK